MIRLKDVIQIFRGVVYHIVRQKPSFCRRRIALGYDASLSVVMDEGG